MSNISEYAVIAGKSFSKLIQTVRTLRDPGGCPWDAEQTHITLRTHLLEEVYELLEAIDNDNPEEIEEELGDVLTQIAFHTDIGRRKGLFDAESTNRKVVKKLRDRHPHVFGKDDKISDPTVVSNKWEDLKRNQSGRTSIVNSLPSTMPALAYASSIQKRVVRSGLDIKWDTGQIEGMFLEFIKQDEISRMYKKAGILLMSLTLELNKLGIDAETALRLTAKEFKDRVLRAEQFAKNTPLSNLEKKDRASIWEKAK